ncbi:hypothetical protein [Rickettsiales endosymbiont of Stachyamoeba lipophora]|uniref:hypothetical protein n=1 Tax=Rickettsiales endosymbiont of Stachyamoeba lipophora TaxID=2486578 RepID=UPI000F64AEBE|nr:hypothetical protein [Rickettsiales endosymbiont of Stachyamoeba lipophora]AZL16331.1 hypothetical protein EF513_07315 [Rickettsiales endosymbiont of Stachyamoeba lipophora]
MKDHYNNIYKYNSWKYGSGFLPKVDIGYIRFLEQFLIKFKIKSMVDFGCGDWQIMSQTKMPDDLKYIGLDISDVVIQKNNEIFANGENVKFIVLEEDYLTHTEHYKADLLIVKNVLELWPLSNIIDFLSKILPNYKYALIKTKYNTEMDNENIELGITDRPLNLLNFNYPLQSEIKLVAIMSSYPYQSLYLWKNSSFNNEESLLQSIDKENNLMSLKLCIQPSKIEALIPKIIELKNLVNNNFITFNRKYFEQHNLLSDKYQIKKNDTYIANDLRKDFRQIVIDKNSDNKEFYFILFNNDSRNEILLNGFKSPDIITFTDSVINDYSIIKEEDFRIMVDSPVSLQYLENGISIKPIC